MSRYIDDSNYYNDRRVIAKEEKKWYLSLDEKKMKAVVERWTNEDTGEEMTQEIHFKYDVCDTCNGKGTHVNPSIDANGLSNEDLYGDPDFAEDYFSGRCDVTCYECNGNRVVAVPDPRDDKEKEILKEIDEDMEEEREYEAMVRSERIMGC